MTHELKQLTNPLFDGFSHSRVINNPELIRVFELQLELPENFSGIKIWFICFLPCSNIRMYLNEVVQQDLRWFDRILHWKCNYL